MTTLLALSKDWLGGTRDYRPSAFWFWNADMDPGQMAEVVREMAANDIREFLVHPIHGLEIEYLSDEYFDRLRLALDLAKQHGLKVWIYDEFGWPTGVAGGIVIREHPEFRNQYLSFSRDASGKVTAAPKLATAVLDNVIGAPWTHNEHGYLDTLSADAVRCFIDYTHERIYSECGDYFGDVITGFFTDEPSTMADGMDGGTADWTLVGMPWTPGLPALFRERFGYDVEPRYAELAGEGTSRLKQDYWSLVRELYAENYHGQIARWCAAHGVKYTGHVGEDRLVQQIRFAGSIFRSLGFMDEPGIDYLGCGPDPEDRFVEQVAVWSVARHTGRDRVYCEAYGITPFDIRLGSMLRRAQMLGIHGIDDIALMGFHQSLHGIRKHTYWPPTFRTAPWWPFFGEYHGAFTRSVGLVSLGKPRARYAILYPQHQLENTDVFYRDIWSVSDPASTAVIRLGLAIYAAGETFEFVFPEMLDQAAVRDGRIVFPNSDYDAILAPSSLADISTDESTSSGLERAGGFAFPDMLDKEAIQGGGASPNSGRESVPAPPSLAYFDTDETTLARLESEGGRVLRGSVAEIEARIRWAPPAWAERISIDVDGSPGDVRVYEFEFPDGRLFALRNVTDAQRRVLISSANAISDWDPLSGAIASYGGKMEFVMEPRSCRYIALTSEPLGQPASDEPTSRIQVEAEWSVTTEQPNMARLSKVQFRHKTLGWLDAAKPNVPGSPGYGPATRIPLEFEGAERIEFRAAFEVESLPESLGLVFERGHVESLAVNGVPLDLSQAVEMPIWDLSCRHIDATAAVATGTNTVEGVITFERFETSVVNDGFYHYHPMPHLDVCLSGSFRLIDGRISSDDGEPFQLPLDLSVSGWEQYCGIARMSARVELDEALAARVRGIAVELTAEDCLEVLVDGASVGKRIVRPYVFGLGPLAAGSHVLELRISSTSGNILDKPSRWGVASVEWLCAHLRT